MAPTPLSAGPP
uniref:Uncharacterized protein n=1 Tax=Rhizophora mucronata TaxID=61149 RepID=A0A2P2PBR6_RHIMU